MTKDRRLLNTKQDKVEFLQWITALRSGEYKQGHGALQDAIGYCCLGVACVLFGQNLPVHREGLYKGRLKGGTPAGCSGKLPKWLLEVNTHVQEHKIGLVRASLVHLNDTAKYKFKQIADHLMKVYQAELDSIPD